MLDEDVEPSSLVEAERIGAEGETTGLRQPDEFFGYKISLGWPGGAWPDNRAAPDVEFRQESRASQSAA